MFRTINLLLLTATTMFASGCWNKTPTEPKKLTHRDLGEAFKQGFETRVRDTQRESNDKELAETQLYASLESLSADDFREAWQTDVDVTDESARDVLSQVVLPLGWTIVDSNDDVARMLDQRVTITESGVPRLKVVEEVCRMIGVTPEYPNPLKENMGGGFLGGFESLARKVAEQTGQELPDEQTQLALRKTGVTFTPGEREHPVTYAGPFMIRVGKLQENAPETTGQIELIAYAPGLPPAVMPLNDSGRLNIASVTSPEGQEMKDRSGGGGIVGGFPWISMEAPIHGLVRDVNAITVSGSIWVDIPTRVESLRFTNVEEGAVQSSGTGSVTITKVDKKTMQKMGDLFSQPKNVRATQVTLDSNPPRDLFHSSFLLPVDAGGNVLPSDHEGYFDEQSHAAYTIWGEPKLLVVKDVLKRETLKFDFEVDVQLKKSSQQPEALASLDFGTHDAPLSLEMLAVNHEGTFPKVELKCINHSNKDVSRFEYTLRYMKPDGQEADDSSSSKSWEIPSGGEAVHEVSALGRDKSLEIAILLRRVVFEDQSTWTAKPDKLDAPYVHATFDPPAAAEDLFFSYQTLNGSESGPIKDGMLFKRRVSPGTYHYFFRRQSKLLASRWAAVESDSGLQLEVQIPDESELGKLIVDLGSDATIERIDVLPTQEDGNVPVAIDPHKLRRWAMPLYLKDGNAEITLYPGKFRIFGAFVEKEEVVWGTRYRDINIEPGTTVSVDSLEWFTDQLDWPAVDLAKSFYYLALRRYNNREESLRAVTRAIELAPDSANYHSFRGSIHANQKDFNAALADCERAIELEPSNPSYTLQRARLNAYMKQYDQAREDIALVLRLAENGDKSAHFNNSVAWILSSTADLDLRDPETALRAARRAVELEGQTQVYWNTLGVAQYRAGAYRPAIESLQKSIELTKGGATSFDLFFLAMAHWQLGEIEEATRLYGEAVDRMEAKRPTNELIRFRKEADELFSESVTVESGEAADGD